MNKNEVNVLALLEEAQGELRRAGIHARAVVVDLIEAASGFLGASFRPDFEGCPDEVKQQYDYFHRRLRAALAAVEPKGKDMAARPKATMRLPPDGFLVGEVRDGAALALLKAWNTGHPGGEETPVEPAIALAAAWRATQPANRRNAGVALVFQGEVYGWKNVLRDPQQERPGVIAVDADGAAWVAEGGNDYDGAARWVRCHE